jgi:hypothetical protein
MRYHTIVRSAPLWHALQPSHHRVGYDAMATSTAVTSQNRAQSCAAVFSLDAESVPAKGVAE